MPEAAKTGVIPQSYPANRRAAALRPITPGCPASDRPQARTKTKARQGLMSTRTATLFRKCGITESEVRSKLR